MFTPFQCVVIGFASCLVMLVSALLIVVATRKL